MVMDSINPPRNLTSPPSQLPPSPPIQCWAARRFQSQGRAPTLYRFFSTLVWGRGGPIVVLSPHWTSRACVGKACAKKNADDFRLVLITRWGGRLVVFAIRLEVDLIRTAACSQLRQHARIFSAHRQGAFFFWCVWFEGKFSFLEGG